MADTSSVRPTGLIRNLEITILGHVFVISVVVLQLNALSSCYVHVCEMWAEPLRTLTREDGLDNGVVDYVILLNCWFYVGVIYPKFQLSLHFPLLFVLVFMLNSHSSHINKCI